MRASVIVLLKVGLVAASVGMASACSDSTAPQVPGSLTVISGNNQDGGVGELLNQPLMVSVKDTRGSPLASIQVQWQITGGGGILSASATSTGADGTTAVTWRLGTTAGPNTVTASVEGLTALAFTATGTPGPPVSVSIHTGNEQTAVAGTAEG